MDQNDRKRAFSAAFQPTPENLNLSSGPPMQGFETPPHLLPELESLPMCLDSNKENEFPFYHYLGAEKKHQNALEAGLQIQREFSPFNGAVGRVYPADPFRNVLGPILPPAGLAPAPGFPDLDYFGLPLAANNEDEFMFSSSPGGMYFDGEPSSDEVTEPHAVPGLGFLGLAPNDDENTLMQDYNPHSGPLEPSALHFQGLTLQDAPIQLVPVLSKFPVATYNRSMVYTIPSSKFADYFDQLNSTDVVIVFDTGHQAITMNKDQLCEASHQFNIMLDTPCAEGFTHCIRLRDDFPYAVLAMLQFIARGIYIFERNMIADYPHITLLDLHLHAYNMGLKYDVPMLRERAITQYTNLAGSILNMRLHQEPIFVLPDDPMWVVGGPPPASGALAVVSSLRDPLAAQYLNNFLDSLVLLWKNTPDRYDAMREAVLELIKPKLTILLRDQFFVSLMSGIIDFGSDIVESLEEDGFDVRIMFPQGLTKGPIVFGAVESMGFQRGLCVARE